ncbi:MAG: hypothetical protein KZQ99_18755 [Candidatus Thiodiazotropha sp. (ex Dulcina madagascariensis)]|nr:hypothetical protein [Candidatus Thiodiazotropha sp. (ex Dulcina madagascariensis)]
MIDPIPHKDLLTRVTRRIDGIGTTTDNLLLLRWRVIGLCQILLGSPDVKTENVIIDSLSILAHEGLTAAAESALKEAFKVAGEYSSTVGDSILPAIANSKRRAVTTMLGKFGRQGDDAIARAVQVIPNLHDRLRYTPSGALLSGLRHRFEIVADIACDQSREHEARLRAAAAILYLDEVHDVIPDSLGLIGLLDDDYALRVVLEEFETQSPHDQMHWAERITALWDDLPYIRGIKLRTGGHAMATTWLDRLNSYVSYTHALERNQEVLILLQPSIACSPVHPIVSLIGLLIFDGLTSSEDLIESLVEGQVYEIDGKFYARYRGVSGPPVEGWIKLEFRDGTLIRPPTIADRMIAVAERRLTTAKSFPANVQTDNAEPIQKFFDWNEAIGAASLSTRILFVTSRNRANVLLGDVTSNGVNLIDDGLVRFSGITPDLDVLRGGLVIVIPNLTVARQVIEGDVGVQAIVVDGFDRLQRGRHDLPFLSSGGLVPPIIVWSPEGYFPADTPSWLSNHRRLCVSQNDLAYILELDGQIDDYMAPSRASLWEAATFAGVEEVVAEYTTVELAILTAIKDFQRAVRDSVDMPNYWQHHFLSSSNVLRLLVSATPTRWDDIRAYAESWRGSFQEQWDTLRPRAAEVLKAVRERHIAIFDYLSRARHSGNNSKGDVVLNFLAGEDSDDWHVVCDRLEQTAAAKRLFDSASIANCNPVVIRDLPVCSRSILIGWPSWSFASKIWAHTPKRLVTIVDSDESRHWKASEQEARKPHGDSILTTVGYGGQPPAPSEDRIEQTDSTRAFRHTTGAWQVLEEEQDVLVSCVFVWLVDETDAKVLARDDRVLTAVGDNAKEKLAYLLLPDDNVILGPGHKRWSPADEFTQAVLGAIEMSHPELVDSAKEWRRALLGLVNDKSLSTEELQKRLAGVGVSRGHQTIVNWLDMESPSPIGPRSIEREIDAIWSLVGKPYAKKSPEEVRAACSQLRSLRAAAGRSLLRLWKGNSVDLGVDESILADLVEKIREQVVVHEVEAVTYGEAPESMIGWWVSQDLVIDLDAAGGAAYIADETADHLLSEDDYD